MLEWLLHAFRHLSQLCLEHADHARRTTLQLATSGGGHSQCMRALRVAGALILTLPEQSPTSIAATTAAIPLGQMAGGWHRLKEEDEEAACRRWQPPDSVPSKPPTEGPGGPDSESPQDHHAQLYQSLLGC